MKTSDGKNGNEFSIPAEDIAWLEAHGFEQVDVGHFGKWCGDATRSGYEPKTHRLWVTLTGPFDDHPKPYWHIRLDTHFNNRLTYYGTGKDGQPVADAIVGFFAEIREKINAIETDVWEEVTR